MAPQLESGEACPFGCGGRVQVSPITNPEPGYVPWGVLHTLPYCDGFGAASAEAIVAKMKDAVQGAPVECIDRMPKARA